jgi:hypothetical protein
MTDSHLHSAAQAAHTKYALVCGGCFRHNGLVGGGKEEWERTRTWLLLTGSWKESSLELKALCSTAVFDRMDMPS